MVVVGSFPQFHRGRVAENIVVRGWVGPDAETIDDQATVDRGVRYAVQIWTMIKHSTRCIGTGAINLVE